MVLIERLIDVHLCTYPITDYIITKLMLWIWILLILRLIVR